VTSSWSFIRQLEFFLSVTRSKKLSLHNSGNQWLFEMKMPYSRWIVIL